MRRRLYFQRMRWTHPTGCAARSRLRRFVRLLQSQNVILTLLASIPSMRKENFSIQGSFESALCSVRSGCLLEWLTDKYGLFRPGCEYANVWVDVKCGGGGETGCRRASHTRDKWVTPQTSCDTNRPCLTDSVFLLHAPLAVARFLSFCSILAVRESGKLCLSIVRVYLDISRYST